MAASSSRDLFLLVGAAAGVYAEFCPSWFTVSSPFFHEQEARAGNVKRIRWGYLAGSGIVVGMGWVAGKETRNPTLFLASLVITAVTVAGYEFMIAHPATDDK